MLATQHATKQFCHVKNIHSVRYQTIWCACAVRLRNKDKIAKWTIFVIPQDSPSLLGMWDIELLNILKIMSEVISDPHESRKFDSQAIKEYNSPSHRTNRAPECKTDKRGHAWWQCKHTSVFQVQHKQSSRQKRIHNEFSDVFFRHRLLSRYIQFID